MGNRQSHERETFSTENTRPVEPSRVATSTRPAAPSPNDSPRGGGGGGGPDDRPQAPLVTLLTVVDDDAAMNTAAVDVSRRRPPPSGAGAHPENNHRTGATMFAASGAALTTAAHLASSLHNAHQLQSVLDRQRHQAADVGDDGRLSESMTSTGGVAAFEPEHHEHMLLNLENKDREADRLLARKLARHTSNIVMRATLHYVHAVTEREYVVYAYQSHRMVAFFFCVFGVVAVVVGSVALYRNIFRWGFAVLSIVVVPWAVGAYFIWTLRREHLRLVHAQRVRSEKGWATPACGYAGMDGWDESPPPMDDDDDDDEEREYSGEVSLPPTEAAPYAAQDVEKRDAWSLETRFLLEDDVFPPSSSFDLDSAGTSASHRHYHRQHLLEKRLYEHSRTPLRNNAMYHEACLLLVTFANFIFVFLLHGSKGTCHYLPMERRLYDCQAATQNEGITIAVFLAGFFLIPLRWSRFSIIAAVAYGSYGVYFYHSSNRTDDATFVKYYISEMMVYGTHLASMIGSLGLFEGWRRRQFESFVRRHQRALMVDMTKEEAKRVINAAIPMGIVSEVLQKLKDSRRARRRRSRSSSSSQQQQQQGGRGGGRHVVVTPAGVFRIRAASALFGFRPHTLVCVLALEGFSSWSSARGPCSTVQLLHPLTELLDELREGMLSPRKIEKAIRVSQSRRQSGEFVSSPSVASASTAGGGLRGQLHESALKTPAETLLVKFHALGDEYIFSLMDTAAAADEMVDDFKDSARAPHGHRRASGSSRGAGGGGGGNSATFLSADGSGVHQRNLSGSVSSRSTSQAGRPRSGVAAVLLDFALAACALVNIGILEVEDVVLDQHPLCTLPDRTDRRRCSVYHPNRVGDCKRAVAPLRMRAAIDVGPCGGIALKSSHKRHVPPQADRDDSDDDDEARGDDGGDAAADHLGGVNGFRSWSVVGPAVETCRRGLHKPIVGPPSLALGRQNPRFLREDLVGSNRSELHVGGDGSVGSTVPHQDIPPSNERPAEEDEGMGARTGSNESAGGNLMGGSSPPLVSPPPIAPTRQPHPPVRGEPGATLRGGARPSGGALLPAVFLSDRFFDLVAPTLQEETHDAMIDTCFAPLPTPTVQREFPPSAVTPPTSATNVFVYDFSLRSYRVVERLLRAAVTIPPAASSMSTAAGGTMPQPGTSSRGGISSEPRSNPFEAPHPLDGVQAVPMCSSILVGVLDAQRTSSSDAEKPPLGGRRHRQEAMQALEALRRGQSNGQRNSFGMGSGSDARLFSLRSGEVPRIGDGEGGQHPGVAVQRVENSRVTGADDSGASLLGDRHHYDGFYIDEHLPEPRLDPAAFAVPDSGRNSRHTDGLGVDTPKTNQKADAQLPPPPAIPTPMMVAPSAGNRTDNPNARYRLQIASLRLNNGSPQLLVGGGTKWGWGCPRLLSFINGPEFSNAHTEFHYLSMAFVDFNTPQRRAMLVWVACVSCVYVGCLAIISSMDDDLIDGPLHDTSVGFWLIIAGAACLAHVMVVVALPGISFQSVTRLGQEFMASSSGTARLSVSEEHGGSSLVAPPQRRQWSSLFGHSEVSRELQLTSLRATFAFVLSIVSIIGYSAAVFVSPQGSYLGNSHIVFLMMCLSMSLLRPSMFRPVLMLVLTDCPICVAHFVRSYMSSEMTTSLRNTALYVDALSIVFCWLIRSLNDEAMRKAYRSDRRVAFLDDELTLQKRELLTALRLVAPQDAALRLLRRAVLNNNFRGYFALADAGTQNALITRHQHSSPRRNPAASETTDGGEATHGIELERFPRRERYPTVASPESQRGGPRGQRTVLFDGVVDLEHQHQLAARQRSHLNPEASRLSRFIDAMVRIVLGTQHSNRSTATAANVADACSRRRGAVGASGFLPVVLTHCAGEMTDLPFIVIEFSGSITASVGHAMVPTNAPCEREDGGCRPSRSPLRARNASVLTSPRRASLSEDNPTVGPSEAAVSARENGGDALSEERERWLTEWETVARAQEIVLGVVEEHHDFGVSVIRCSGYRMVIACTSPAVAATKYRRRSGRLNPYHNNEEFARGPQRGSNATEEGASLALLTVASAVEKRLQRMANGGSVTSSSSSSAFRDGHTGSGAGPSAAGGSRNSVDSTAAMEEHQRFTGAMPPPGTSGPHRTASAAVPRGQHEGAREIPPTAASPRSSNAFFMFRMLMHVSPLLPAVLGSGGGGSAVFFDYFGPGLSAALRVIDEVPWGSFFGTDRSLLPALVHLMPLHEKWLEELQKAIQNDAALQARRREQPNAVGAATNEGITLLWNGVPIPDRLQHTFRWIETAVGVQPQEIVQGADGKQYQPTAIDIHEPIVQFYLGYNERLRFADGLDAEVFWHMNENTTAGEEDGEDMYESGQGAPAQSYGARMGARQVFRVRGVELFSMRRVVVITDRCEGPRL